MNPKTPSTSSWNPDDARTLLVSFDEAFPAPHETVIVAPELFAKTAITQRPSPPVPEPVLLTRVATRVPFNANETQMQVLELQRTTRRSAVFRVLAGLGVAAIFALALAAPSLVKSLRSSPAATGVAQVQPAQPSTPAVLAPVSAPKSPAVTRAPTPARASAPSVPRTKQPEFISGRVRNP